MSDSRAYRAVGVSSGKDDIVAAARLQGEGLFPGAFCKVVPDALTGSERHCVALHADGAGTKSVVAYLAFRESGDPAVFASLAQDALVMNVDDLVCVGARGPFVVTNVIGRHRGLVPHGAVEAVIGGYARCAEALSAQGVAVALCGGETADLGDVVRTITVDAAAVCRLRRDEVIDGAAVTPGDVIVGLSSVGTASFEDRPNSGVGSNGLTLARHVLLRPEYRTAYPEACAPDLPAGIAYRGVHRLEDRPVGWDLTVGEALLSPTRSYAPIVVACLQALGRAVHGVVHCTGGGQTKCLRLRAPVSYVKDDVFPVPPLFALLQDAAAMGWEEMYRVFNMGHRMELFVPRGAADEVVAIAAAHGVEAKVVGRCVPLAAGPRLVLEGPDGPLRFGGAPGAAPP
jgi:phosphoribosylformylglycinamidine cyclo-ligase